MILHIIPDYMNKPLYHHLLEELETHEIAKTQSVYTCDNSSHINQHVPENVHVVNRSFSLWERFLFFPKQRYLMRDIESVVSFPDVQLIHAHTLFSSGYLAFRLHQKYGIPYIIAVRNTDVNVFFRHMPHLRSLGRRIAANAQKIIFISPTYQKQVLGKYLPSKLADKSIVIPNGIDPLFLSNSSLHTPSDEIRLIYVGRMEKDKNVHTIIKVVDALNKQGMKTKLCLVGSITDPSYKTLIDTHQNDIEWYDQCPKEQVLAHLRKNDIFIMPSYHETFGLVYAEAMSQGLPVIYTKGQGFDGFFEDGKVGYAVPAEDVEYITRRIMDIHRNYDQIAHRCTAEAAQFNWKNIAEKYKQLYLSIISK